VYCLNKIDAISIEELDLLYRIPHAVPISSEHGWNIDELMEAMWDKLNLKRVYTKPKGKQPDYSAPVVLRSNRSTVEDFVSSSATAPSGGNSARPTNAPRRPLSPIRVWLPD
jgi:uncharacterized protein